MPIFVLESEYQTHEKQTCSSVRTNRRQHYITAINDYIQRTKLLHHFWNMERDPELKNTKSLSMDAAEGERRGTDIEGTSTGGCDRAAR